MSNIWYNDHDEFLGMNGIQFLDECNSRVYCVLRGHKCQNIFTRCIHLLKNTPPPPENRVHFYINRRYRIYSIRIGIIQYIKNWGPIPLAMTESHLVDIDEISYIGDRPGRITRLRIRIQASTSTLPMWHLKICHCARIQPDNNYNAHKLN
jgi:hypothetical protein